MQKTARKNTATKLGLTAASVLALTFGGVAPAFAADIQIGPDAVAGYEVGGVGTEAGFNYDQWHVGNVETVGTPTSASLTFNECSVTTLAPVERTVTQVLKGFPVDARPSTEATGTTAELEAIVNSTSITVLKGSVTIQVPVFYYESSDTTTPSFTTFRTMALEAGTHSLAGLEITDSTGADLEGMTFQDLFDEFQQYLDESDNGSVMQLLGVGFTGSEGAEIASLSFGGDTYYFGAGDCAPTPPESEEPNNPTPPKHVQTAAR